MRRPKTLAVALLLTLSSLAIPQIPPIEKGQTIAKVVCSGNPNQTYALYVPSGYSSTTPSAIIYVFDPAARGAVAVEAIRTAAERYGYIVAASNSSRNGSMGGSSDAANAIFQDTHQRFAIDDRRIYTAGFSGGARVATQFALMCKTCIAGVIANGAGFPQSAAPKSSFGFAYFLAIGNADFNFREMVELRGQLEQIHANYRIHIFNGSHEWAPDAAWQDALRWMNLQAMRSGALTKDPKAIQQIFQEELESAHALDSSGNVLAAERDYESMVRDFNGLTDVASPKARASGLKASKAFKVAEKQERSELDQQTRLTDRASAQIRGIATNDTDLTTYADIKRTILGLKDDLSKSPNPPDSHTLVLKRALGELVVQAYEAGERSMETRNYVAALAYFDLVAAGAKSPGGARFERARVYAAQGDAKKCLAELKQAQAGGFHDASALDAAEFNPYRQLPEFQSLASEWSKQAQP
jgi:predicted esterase